MSTTPHPKPHNAETIEALRYLIIRRLVAEGWTAQRIEGFLVAMSAFGGLREGAPKWLRKQQALVLHSGKGIQPNDVGAAARHVDNVLEEIQEPREGFGESWP